jgi:hypothetical protein
MAPTDEIDFDHEDGALRRFVRYQRAWFLVGMTGFEPVTLDAMKRRAGPPLP